MLQLFYGIAAPMLKLMTTKTAANGILYRGEMFVLSAEQIRKLFSNESIKFESWLDLGSGDGGALVKLVTGLAENVHEKGWQ